MTNILVPTDFTPASLQTAELALREAGDSNINIILFHAFELPSSPFDLIRTGYREPAQELMTEAFRQACRQLKIEYPRQLGKIMVRCMNGNTKALFRNFADANDIDLIFCPESFTYSKIHERSLDPKPFFKKSGIPMLRKASRDFVPAFSNTQIVAEPQPVRAS